MSDRLNIAAAPYKRLVTREHSAAVFAVPLRDFIERAVEHFEALGAVAALPLGQGTGNLRDFVKISV